MNDEWPRDMECYQHTDEFSRRLIRSWKCQLVCIELGYGFSWHATIAPNARKNGDQPYHLRSNPTEEIQGHLLRLLYNHEPFSISEEYGHELLDLDVTMIIQEHVISSFYLFYEKLNEPTSNRTIDKLQYTFHGIQRYRNRWLYNGTFEFSLQIPRGLEENTVEGIAVRAIKNGIFLWSALLEWLMDSSDNSNDSIVLRCFPFHLNPLYHASKYKRSRLKCHLNYSIDNFRSQKPMSLDKQFMMLIMDSHGYQEIVKHIEQLMNRELTPEEIHVQYKSHKIDSLDDDPTLTRLFVQYNVLIRL